MQHHGQEIHTFGQSRRQVAVGKVVRVGTRSPILLDCGVDISNVPVAYQTYGTLNADKSNAIMLCHALTGDQYAASGNPVTGKAGWWHFMIGSGKPIDTDKYFVICSNVLGSCVGTYGPKHCNAQGEPLALNFPVITIRDMVAVQKRLLDALEIECLFAVIGGSMGGMQVLQWAVDYPDYVRCAIALATTSRHNAQNIAYHEIGRQAIMADPQWCGGRYLSDGSFPVKGLSVARMTAHVTYLSEHALQHKFGRMFQHDEQAPSYSFDANFQVESYLRHQGVNFVERFDPNSYLYITKAADYFDLAHYTGGNLAQAFGRTPIAFCLMSFSTDWLYPTSESRDIMRSLNALGADVSFTEIESSFGHDGFLVEQDDYMRVIAGFLDGKAKEAGLI